eukprot:Clim_evm34s204 gene=Clim_evmTU34s204
MQASPLYRSSGPDVTGKNRSRHAINLNGTLPFVNQNLQTLRRQRSTYIIAFMVMGVVMIMYAYGLLTYVTSGSGTGTNTAYPTGGDTVRPTRIYKDLVVLVVSAAGNKERRDVIRETWAKPQWSLPSNGYSTDVLFVVGGKDLTSAAASAVKNEHAEHGDMMLLPKTNDTYEALTDKVLEALRTAHTTYLYGFVVKCDDDSFVDIPALQKSLHEEPDRMNEPYSYIGYFSGKGEPRRGNQDVQWAENNYDLCDFYIPYAYGGGYTLSYKSAEFIVQNTNILRRFFSEDVTVGTALAPIAVKRIHDVRFDTEFKTRGCRQGFLIRHKLSPQDMRGMADALTRSNGEVSCPNGTDELKRRSYAYDWSQRPSLCCENREEF